MENNLKSNSYNGLTLAYIGDAVYELYIRNFVISCILSGFIRIECNIGGIDIKKKT